MISRAGIFVAFFVAAAPACPQAPSPAFEVASVRQELTPRNMPPVRGGPGTDDPGRITYSDVPLIYLIAQAFDMDIERIEGRGWIHMTDAYSITATMPPQTTRLQFHAMLQNLLAERFGLRVHRETRSLPGFELTRIPNGPKLSEWTPEPIPDGPTPRWSEDAEGFPILSKGRTACTYGGMAGVMAAQRVTCRRSMPDFAQDLGRFIKIAEGLSGPEPKPEVIDRTGLPGIYEFHFVFEGVLLLPNGAIRSSDPSGAPSLSNALEKQLGLKLVKTRNVPVTFLVVDSAQRTPTDN